MVIPRIVSEGSTEASVMMILLIPLSRCLTWFEAENVDAFDYAILKLLFLLAHHHCKDTFRAPLSK
jgi:hypothetical protein